MMSAAFPSDCCERLISLGITQVLDKPLPLSQLRALARRSWKHGCLALRAT